MFYSSIDCFDLCQVSERSPAHRRARTKRSLRCPVCGERVCKLSELRKKRPGGKIDLVLTSDNPNPYLRTQALPTLDAARPCPDQRSAKKSHCWLKSCLAR